MSITNMYIGRDYIGTLTGVAFNGTPGDSGVTITWELLNRFGVPIASGSGDYVSSGQYTFTVDYTLFDSERPLVPDGYLPGRLLVHINRDEADGSVGKSIRFMFPPETAV